jgi:hypothetical protein
VLNSSSKSNDLLCIQGMSHRVSYSKNIDGFNAYTLLSCCNGSSHLVDSPHKLMTTRATLLI